MPRQTDPTFLQSQRITPTCETQSDINARAAGSRCVQPGAGSTTHVRKTNRALNVPIDVVSFVAAQNIVLDWARRRSSRYVVLANAHVVVTSRREKRLGEAVWGADLATPDGAPVAWMLRALGHSGQERVSGPDLMWALLMRCEAENVPVYFYGSTDATLNALLKRVGQVIPNIRVAGAEAPPFHTGATCEVDSGAVRRINDSQAGLVFVGLGCPKQEVWMNLHRGQVNAVMLGVGAAFDFHAGTMRRAPQWMRGSGLEWLHRLIREPRRLWKRYLITNSLFVAGAAAQLVAANVKKLRRRRV